MRRQWSWVDDLGQEDPSGCRNGEQDAEAVERPLLWPLPPSRRGRNGEQEGEAVGLVGVGQRIGGALESERRTGCGGSGAIDPTSSTAGPKQSERRTGCGGRGAGAMTPGGGARRGGGTENRMRRQWSLACGTGNLPRSCRNGEQDAEAVERLAVLI